MAKHKKVESVSLDDVRERAEALAGDDATLGKFVGPKSIPAVKGMMKFLADILSPDPQMTHTPEPVKKLRRD